MSEFNKFNQINCTIFSSEYEKNATKNKLQQT